MMDPLISIIIPVYNTEKFLSTCLDSIRDQTFKEIEVLCINDGSTDRSGEILAEYAKNDSRFRVFDQENSGSATARNRGLAEARGKYIMFCDSDDRYKPNMCERMFHSIEEQNVDFVMCNTIVEQLDRKVTISPKDLFPFKEGIYFLRNRLRLYNNILLWNKIFRKDLIDHYNILFPDGYRGDDDAFCKCYFFVSNSVYMLDEKLYYYVQRSGSIMDEWNKKVEYKDCINVFHIAEHLYTFLEKNHLLKEKEVLFCQFFVKNCRYLWHFLPPANSRKMLEKIRHWVLQCQIEKWPFYQPRKLQKSLQTGNDQVALDVFFNKSILLLRLRKYTLLEWIFTGQRRKKYHRKKIRILHELRQADRCLFHLSKKAPQ